ncbi:fimbria/pilus periplasmic chaperone [Burkholderiaceae bacterium FT117]|uniref:fimbrial biogenesis chaperone n=1 Tax=Zeimonas sediminis TaxID=2944268 RepID=UPI002343153B|nr:fimbria/pilus periplasmic chaperone [Zeimonas sediminis]MCM5569962.1 fimbria/pilus periplasmic chaperone [Zeimonas sediminis]
MRVPLLLRAAAAIALLALGQAAWASGGFGLSPMRLDLTAQAPMAAFTLSNSGSEPIVVQAQPMAWRQVDGRDVQEATRALLVNPGIVSLAPGEQQVVRVALRAAPDRRLATGYRMLFTEVPQSESGPVSGTGIRIIKRMDVPVFVAPLEGETRPDGSIAADSTGDILGLSFANEGTGYWRLGDLKVVDAASGRQLTPPAVIGVLPGGMRRLELRLGDGPAPEKVVVEADVDGQPFRTELAIGRR